MDSRSSGDGSPSSGGVAGATTGTQAGVTAASARSTVLTRWVRRLDDGPGVFWAALLPAAGLAALTWFTTGPFAANEIEANVAQGVRAHLRAQGHGWAEVRASGQEVLLGGQPPVPGAGDAALAAARAATCATWAGPLVCAVTVVGAFAPPAGAGLAAPGITPPPMAASPAAAPPVGVPNPAPSAPRTEAATDGRSAPGGAAAASSPAEQAARACEARFGELLAGTRLEFASGGSALDARSGPLLDRLAAAAEACPGGVRIEGHTDSVGDAGANQRLSEARAAAVRDALVGRGLAAERLSAVGFGDSQPRADNTTEAGRAVNRRIEFKAVP